MRLIPARRSTSTSARYLDAARDVLGSPGRRVTALAVLMAHDIACASPDLVDSHLDGLQREQLLAGLATRYGVDLDAVGQERAALSTVTPLRPVARPRPPEPRSPLRTRSA